MTEQNLELVEEKQEPIPLPTASVSNPATMLQTALEKGVDTETLEKFMDLHERWQKGEARKAYMEAIAEFKSDPPKVVKDMVNKQYGSRYSSIGNLVNTVNESLGKNKLHAHWDVNQTDLIEVTCVLSHALGHSDSVTMKGPPDESGSKNALQQIKSTVTYLKISTFEAVTGIASIDGNSDDDGNGAQGQAPETISEEQTFELMELIEEAGLSVEEFCQTGRVNAVHEIQKIRFDAAKNSLMRRIKAKGNSQ